MLAMTLIVNSSVSSANMFKAHEAIADKDYQTATIELTKSAQIGQAEAQFNLGVIHLQGLAGKVDHKQAMAWFYLASEYKYPQAIELSAKIFQNLSKSEQQQALDIADDLATKYSKKTVSEQYYPQVDSRRIAAQKNDKRAKILKRGQMNYSSDSKARAHNQSVVNAAVRNYNSGDRSGIASLNKKMIKSNSGRVEVIFDARADGRVQDTEVIFSWPKGRFENTFVAAIDNSKLKAAERDGQPVEQYGMFKHVNIYYNGASNLKKDYPHLYKALLSLQRSANKSAANKYKYACFLRAYNDLFDDQQLEAFQPVLLDAAEQGFALAQYDYGMYLIYRNDEVDAGLAWIVKAAKYGLLEAEYRLGDMLYQSPSPYLQQDISKAKYWLKKAANNSHSKAQQKLIEIHFANDSIDEDFARKAISWLEEIEDQNLASPQTYYLLAKAYYTTGNKYEALEYLDEAISVATDLKWKTDDWADYRIQIKG